jgi:3-dehydroquinate synthase
VVVGRGAITQMAPEVAARHRQARVVYDVAVEPVAARLTIALGKAGVESKNFAIEGGERAKRLRVLERLLAWLEETGLDRSGAIVAVGGGTVGDLAGFAAAIFLRGVAHWQVPTTLVAMVDASVGGKTGIDGLRTKNAVGAIWQPAGVFADLDTLATLPAAERRSGWAEVVKYAVAMDGALAEQLARNGAGADLEPVVARCVELKAGVVVADERDHGPRAILNYGHTVGHALEAASGFRLMHGIAVAHGMRAAGLISERLGLAPGGFVAEQDRLLERFELPGPPPPIAPEPVVELVGRDKKARGGRVAWVLARSIGVAEPGHEVPDPVVGWAVREVLAS